MQSMWCLTSSFHVAVKTHTHTAVHDDTCSKETSKRLRSDKARQVLGTPLTWVNIYAVLWHTMMSSVPGVSKHFAIWAWTVDMCDCVMWDTFCGQVQAVSATPVDRLWISPAGIVRSWLPRWLLACWNGCRCICQSETSCRCEWFSRCQKLKEAQEKRVHLQYFAHAIMVSDNCGIHSPSASAAPRLPICSNPNSKPICFKNWKNFTAFMSNSIFNAF